VPLSEKGIKQVEDLSLYILRLVSLTAVYCSDLSRALKSAEIIARLHSLNPIVAPSLRERNFGHWEGMSFDEIKVKYPGEFDDWAGNPLTFRTKQWEQEVMKDKNYRMKAER
jgi:broad specificity phosphatase PhoE